MGGGTLEALTAVLGTLCGQGDLQDSACGTSLLASLSHHRRHNFAVRDINDYGPY